MINHRGLIEKILIAVVSVIMTWVVSLFTIHGTVNLHSYKLNTVESSISEIKQDIKTILKELRK